MWDPLYWGGMDTVSEVARRNFSVILSHPDYLYLDMPHEFNPKERGYYWASRSQPLSKPFFFSPENLPMNAETSLGRDGAGFSLRGTEEKPTRVLGISGHQWSEVVRTDDQMECMMWPRMVRAVYLCIWCVCVSVRE